MSDLTKEDQKIIAASRKWSDFLTDRVKQNLNQVDKPDYWTTDVVEKPVLLVIGHVCGRIIGRVISGFSYSLHPKKNKLTDAEIRGIIDLAIASVQKEHFEIAEEIITENANVGYFIGLLVNDPSKLAAMLSANNIPASEAENYVLRLAKEMSGEWTQVIYSATPLVLRLAGEVESKEKLQETTSSVLYKRNNQGWISRLFGR